MKKTREQQKVYAFRRMSAACDRNITAERPEDKAKAGQWAKVWARRAGIKPPVP